MNAQIIRIIFGAGIAALAAISLFLLPTPTRASGSTYNVNSTLDEPAADASTGNCISTPSGKCTLRAAVMVANFVGGSSTIVVPAGTYMLTRSGYEDAALVGDLDIAHTLTVQGAGSGATIVDGNGGVTHDRVFQVLASATAVTMTGMTIRNGVSLSSTVGTIGGGGLLIEGTGSLHLSDVLFDGNTALNGGGIYANFSIGGGSVMMDGVTLHANVVTAGGVGAGGGAFIYVPSSLSQVAIRNSLVYSNTADGTGGGFFVDGNNTIQWSIQNTQIYSNTADSGGGISNNIPLTMSDSHLHNNSAIADGGGIEAFSPFTILRSTLDSNTAIRYGGAIFSLQTAGSPQDFAHIAQSTLSGNGARYGGAIYHDGFITPASMLNLLNSTVSGNTAFLPGGQTGSSDGGGIYIYGGQAQLLNATIAGNNANPGFGIRSHVARGGGLFITATATITIADSIVAKNVESNGITVGTNDDCYSTGTTGELAFDLFTTLANCSISGPQGGLITGQDPLLKPLGFYGGSTQTQALQSGSPAIDSAAMTGCFDDKGATLTIDQRGFVRPVNGGVSLRCDMGAYEFNPFWYDYLPFITR